jgi:hypothetical protein
VKAALSFQNPRKVDPQDEKRRQIYFPLAGHLNAANYRFLKLIAEFDRRNGWVDTAQIRLVRNRFVSAPKPGKLCSVNPERATSSSRSNPGAYAPAFSCACKHLVIADLSFDDLRSNTRDRIAFEDLRAQRMSCDENDSEMLKP